MLRPGEAAGTILCATNEAQATDVFRSALSGYELVVAATGFDALRRVNTRVFDVYVLDYWLPDWHGTALCRVIRELDPHGPILFCTRAGREIENARAMRAGASAYLVKPIDPLMLKSRIETLITLAASESLRAKIDEEYAIQEELERRVKEVRVRVADADRLLASSVERTARTKALQAFLHARGARAHFERWWPQVFSSVRANHAAQESRDSENQSPTIARSSSFIRDVPP